MASQPTRRFGGCNSQACPAGPKACKFFIPLGDFADYNPLSPPPPSAELWLQKCAVCGDVGALHIHDAENSSNMGDRETTDGHQVRSHYLVALTSNSMLIERHPSSHSLQQCLTILRFPIHPHPQPFRPHLSHLHSVPHKHALAALEELLLG